MRKCFWCATELKADYLSERINGTIRLFCSTDCITKAKEE